MSETLPLDDGGPLHHPDQPLGFHPALRAAAFFLRACEEVQPQLFRDLGESFAHTRLPSERRRHRLAAALRGWASRHHLESPYVLEVLFLTLTAWKTARRRLALARHDREVLSPRADRVTLERLGAVEERCRQILDGHGPWIDLLTLEPEEAPLAPLLVLSTPLPHLRVPRKTPSPLRLELPAWNAELERWEDSESRLRRAFEAALQRHQRSTRDRLLEAGFEEAPVMRAEHHFRWLALRQLRGWRPSQIARRSRVTVAAVSLALRHLAKLVDLPIRPVKSGPEEL